MPKRHTVEEVKGLCATVGLEFLDDHYINQNTHHLFKCCCGKKFYTIFNMIKQGDKLNCGRCNLPKIGDKFNSWTVVKVVENLYKKGGRIICDCDCGNQNCEPHHWSEITKGLSKTCGHCNDPKVNDKCNRLTVIEVKPSYAIGCQVRCRCDCGNETGWIKGNRFTNGNDISCGRCRVPQVGDRFGKLTAIEVNTTGNNGCKVIFQCECGRKIEPIFAVVYQGQTRSCGNCTTHRKGRFTSQKALELHQMVEEILGPCEHNLRIDGTHFDIVSVDKKIIVEFDGYYWHRVKKDLTQKDKKDTKKAQANGYQVLRVKSDGNELPTKSQLEKVLFNHFQHGYRKWTITLPSWKQQEKYYETRT